MVVIGIGVLGLSLDGRFADAWQAIRPPTVGPLRPLAGSVVIGSEFGAVQGSARLITCESRLSPRIVIERYRDVVKKSAAKGLPVLFEPENGRLAFYADGGFWSILAYSGARGGSRYLLMGGPAESTGSDRVDLADSDGRVVRQRVPTNPVTARRNVERQFAEDGWTQEPDSNRSGSTIWKNGNRIRVVRVVRDTNPGRAVVTWVEKR